MAEHKDRFDAAGASVIAVGFENIRRLAWLKNRIQSPFLFVSDENRDAYRAFSLGRAPWSRTYLHPGVIGGYARMLARGQRPDVHRGQDRRQLGGDVILDARGRVVFSHPERGPEDRAPVATIVSAAETAASSL
jgi:hypothetical protein